MSESVDGSTLHYAVIAIRSEPRRERLVIAYPDEKTLRTAIAGPSIIALGYGSCDQAVAEIDCCRQINGALQKGPEAAIVRRNEQSKAETHPAKPRSTGSSGLAWTRSAIHHVLQHSLAAGIVLFYSKNILSATVRAFISF